MARPPAANGHQVARATAPAAEPRPATATPSVLATLLSERRDQIAAEWIHAQLGSGAYRAGRVSEADLSAESIAVVDALNVALAESASVDVGAPEYGEVIRLLSGMSADRARQGYSPTETALAIFALKQPLVAGLEALCAGQPEVLARESQAMHGLVDGLGLQTFAAYVVTRERVIASQQESMLELSTPVVKLWDGILALPLIGTLDSSRTQIVMESLLQAIVDTESQVAIIDITGVSVVDTLVAQHLLKTVAATRLMGAECIISGIRPQIAQTMVHLGVDLGEVVTKATLADAFRVAMRRVGADLAGGAVH